MVDVSTLFNSTGEVGQWISNSTTNITGSLFLTVLLMLMFLVLMIILFRMPEFFVFLILMPLIIVLSGITEIASSMSVIIGLAILIIALGLYAMYPSK